MKKTIREFAAILCILVVTLAVLLLASSVVTRKDSISKNADFFDQEETMDILFFGSSHMLNAIFPVELWNDYGVTSYNMAGHGSRIPTSYWIMRNAFDYTVPKVVVVDCYFLSKDEMRDGPEEFLHISFDSFPLTDTKIQAMNELLGEGDDKSAFLWPLSTYHNRWKELSEIDFFWGRNPEKGGSIRIGFSPQLENEKTELGEQPPINSKGVIYLRKMIEYCLERDIEVMLTYMPFAAADWAQKENQMTQQIAKEYGVAYASLEELSEQINFTTDFSDNGHLNYSGGTKITEYIGKRIVDEFGLQPRAEADCLQWVADAEKYAEHKHTLIQEQTSAAMFLPLLTDDTLTTVMLHNGRWDYPAAEAMLADWGVPQQVLDENKTFIAIIDNDQGACQLVMEGEKQQTAFGVVALEQNDGVFTVMLDDEVQFTLTPQDDIGMWARIMDTKTGTLIYETLFNTKGHH